LGLRTFSPEFSVCEVEVRDVGFGLKIETADSARVVYELGYFIIEAHAHILTVARFEEHILLPMHVLVHFVDGIWRRSE